MVGEEANEDGLSQKPHETNPPTVGGRQTLDIEDFVKLFKRKNTSVERSGGDVSEQSVKEKLTRLKEEAKRQANEVKEGASSVMRSERVQQQKAAVVGAYKKTAAQAANVLEKSRQSRLVIESGTKPLNKVQAFFLRGPMKRAQAFFREGPAGWLSRTGIEMLPFAGDVVTGINAVIGLDILTGRQLDTVGRVLNGIATAIPFAPGTVLVEVFGQIRKGLEDYSHASGTGDEPGKRAALDQIAEGATGLGRAARKKTGDSPSEKLPRDTSL